MSNTTTYSWWERFSGWLLVKMGGPSLLTNLPSYSSLLLRFQDDMTTKEDRIEACLSRNPVNLWELRELALSKGGLMTPRLRQKAWPLLVGLHSITSSSSEGTDRTDENNQGNASTSSSSSTSNNTGRNRATMTLSDSTNISNNSSSNNNKFQEEKKMETWYEASLDLIKRDVGRSVVFRYKEKTPIPTYATERLGQALEDTIRSSSSATASSGVRSSSKQQQALLPPRSSSGGTDGLSKTQPPQEQQSQQHYHYYQGLHDVAGVVLHQLDYQADLGTSILQRLAQSHWRDSLRESFGSITWILNHLFLPLVEQVEPFVHYQLQVAQMEMSNLILPWMITWFTHDIFEAETAGRLVDALMVSHPLMPLYLSVALLTHPRCKTEVLQADPNDPASLFVTLKQLPKYICSDDKADDSRRVTVQELLDDALTILHKFPPRSLLDLIDPQVSPRASVLQRANSISMFQAARSWNLASFSSTAKNDDGNGDYYSSDLLLLGPSTSHTYLRAKLATGVPLLMTTVGPRWTLVRRRIRRSRQQQEKRKTKGTSSTLTAE